MRPTVLVSLPGVGGRAASLVLLTLAVLVASCGSDTTDATAPSTAPSDPGATHDPDASPSEADASVSEADATPSGSDSTARRGPPVCGDVLRQGVDAAPWATRRAGIAAYHYVADPVLGLARVELRDADGRSLGTVEASQRFGEEGTPDGAMVGVLSVDGAERARLVTTGRDVGPAGYRVHATLSAGDGTLHVEARFRNHRCFDDVGEDAPPCAGGLDLAGGPHLLPSCGVILEQTLHEGRAPVLTDLMYAVADPGGAPAEREGLRRVDGAALRTFAAVSGGIPATAADLAAWDAGAALLADDALTLLATAWLDRRWWRALEHHIAYCGVAALPAIDGDDAAPGSVRKRCPGTQDNNAWGSPSGGSNSSVWGDPHLVTLDGLAYDLQTTGEVVLVRAIAGDPFEVQGRFEALENPALPACGDVSWNTAGATVLAGRRVTVTSRPAFVVAIDGTPVTRAEDLPELPDGAGIDLGPGRVTLTWPGGEQVTFLARTDLPAVGRSLSVDVQLPDHRRGQVRGLLGTFDGSTESDLVLPDGTRLPQPASFETLHGRLADAWRVTAAESLHDHAQGEGPDTFHIPGFPSGPVRLQDLPADRVATARERCAAAGIAHPHLLDTCAFDAVCLDDPRQGELSADAPLPSAVLPPGRGDLRLAGALALHDPRLPLDTTAAPDPGTCAPWAPPAIAVVTEADALTLPDALPVRLAAPGTTDAQRTGPTATLDAGTRVTVHALLRPAPANPDLRQHGTLRTDRPILGVLVDDGLAPLDTLLESSPAGWSGPDVRGLRHPLDALVLGDDRRTLSITLAGAHPQRLRVLVEAP